MEVKSSNICAIIPARYESTRLPGKPLVDFHGKPMIQWVYEAAAAVYEQVAIATDDKRIVEVVESFDGVAIITAETHTNGTSRVHEAYQLLGWSTDYVVNIQGDEPMIKPESLRDLNGALLDNGPDIATLVAKVTDENELFNQSEVFVVRNNQDYALYFSRAVIPHLHRVSRENWLEKGSFLKHVGLYAYKPDVLNKIIYLPPGHLELTEGLEQNRWLENRYQIKTAITKMISYPVDTPDDVKMVRDLMTQKR